VLSSYLFLVSKRKLAQELTGEWDWSLVPYLKCPRLHLHQHHALLTRSAPSVAVNL
jgi:hypothetical protein